MEEVAAKRRATGESRDGANGLALVLPTASRRGVSENDDAVTPVALAQIRERGDDEN